MAIIELCEHINGLSNPTNGCTNLDVSSSCDFNLLKFDVLVNSKSDCNAFEIEMTQFEQTDWIECIDIDNLIEVRIKPNYTVYDRNATIYVYDIFNHNNVASINIIQKKSVYTLNILSSGNLQNVKDETETVATLNDSKLTISHVYIQPVIIDSEKIKREFLDTLIEVSVGGGSEEFIVKSVKQYIGQSYNLVIDDVPTKLPIEKTYDKGVIFTALSTTQQIERYCNENEVRTVDNNKKYLLVRTYGRIFVDEENYYEVTLMHKDCRDITETIKVGFEKQTAELKLSFDGVEINSDGDEQIVDIWFDNSYDYGYETEIIYENNDNDKNWIYVIENPTSITIGCYKNVGEDNRKCTVNVCSRDDKNIKKTLTVTQKVIENSLEVTTLNTLSVNTLSINNDVEEVEFTVYAYGPDRHNVEMELYTDNNVIDIDEVTTSETEGCVAYRCKAQVNNDMTINTEVIDFYMNDENVKTLTIERELGDNRHEYNHINWQPILSSDGTKISIFDDPTTTDVDEGDMDMVHMQSSASWCRPTIKQYIDDDGYSFAEITFEESEPNKGSSTRNSRFSIYNVNDQNQKRRYIASQEAGHLDENGVYRYGKTITLKEC